MRKACALRAAAHRAVTLRADGALVTMGPQPGSQGRLLLRLRAERPVGAKCIKQSGPVAAGAGSAAEPEGLRGFVGSAPWSFGERAGAELRPAGPGLPLGRRGLHAGWLAVPCHRAAPAERSGTGWSTRECQPDACEPAPRPPLAAPPAPVDPAPVRGVSAAPPPIQSITSW